MDKFLRPDRFEANLDSSDSMKEWKHWYRTFQNFVSAIKVHRSQKLNILINYIGPSVYEYISECSDYDTAIETLEQLYVKPKNEVFARHILTTRRQGPSESLHEYLQVLKQLSSDCNYKAVTAVKYKEESIRDAFISGLKSHNIRLRLLENKTLDLRTAFDQALALELAQKINDSYTTAVPSFSVSRITSNTEASDQVDCSQYEQSPTSPATPVRMQKCFFCGNNRHARSVCPARKVLCKKCGKKGHFAKICKSTTTLASTSAATNTPTLATVIAASPGSLSEAVTTITVDNHNVSGLINTGSTENYISQHIVQDLGLHVYPGDGQVTMAVTDYTSSIQGYCVADVQIQGHHYDNLKLSVLPNLCSDLLLGHDFLKITSSSSSQGKRKSKGLKSEPKIKRSRIMQLSHSDCGKHCYSSNSWWW